MTKGNNCMTFFNPSAACMHQYANSSTIVRIFVSYFIIIVKGLVMKQFYALYVLLYSYWFR